jgi:predicted molibdopterin-dependent oxidoreductase YjgC
VETKEVTLTINGIRVTAMAGATILEAAQSVGIRIPTLCHHADLTPTGACRMCLVKVERARDLQTACSTPVADGMVVETDTEEIHTNRKFVLEMLLKNHPNDCMTCESNGDCELQDLVYEYGVDWAAHYHPRHQYEVDSDPNPFIVVDRNKCILCGRCVRACGEIQNRDVWNFAYRGAEKMLIAGADQEMLEAHCESCGQCVAYCPVGALTDRMSLAAGRAYEVQKVRTTCSYCGVGCTFDLNVKDGKVIRVTSAHDSPVNGMALCVKGRYGYDYVHHPERLTTPLVRASLLGDRASDFESLPGTDFVQTDWDTALGIVADTLGDVKKKHGGDAIALLASAKCTNEDNYVFQKFTRAMLGTNNVDHCARL